MPTAKLTSKGQVTIPKEIRDALHLHTGDNIDFFVSENGEAIIRPIVKRVDEVFGILKNKTKKSFTVEDIDQELKKRLKEKFK